MTLIDPVIFAEWGPSNQTTSSATSSAVMAFPSGQLLQLIDDILLGLGARFALTLERRTKGGGIDRAGSDRIDPYSEPTEFGSRLLRDPQNRRLARPVETVVGNAA